MMHGSSSRLERDRSLQKSAPAVKTLRGGPGTWQEARSLLQYAACDERQEGLVLCIILVS